MPLHHTTPLLPSIPLQQRVNKAVWLKMESSQPSASFKMRGMGLAAERAVAAGATQLVSSSGGNAGYAVACAGRALSVPVTVVVPTTTDERMRSLIESTGATVEVAGSVWDEAHQHACLIAEASGGALLHPFDHPDIWDGHASVIHEVHAAGLEPGWVVVSVGGGGLLTGVLQGMNAVGWTSTRVLAVETAGAASFAAAHASGAPVQLESISSIAVTLGARRVCSEVIRRARQHDVTSCVVSDAAAVGACVQFLDDHRVMVEPSCGAALSAVYDRHPDLMSVSGPVLVIVCGGAGVTRSQLETWAAALEVMP